MTELQDQSKFGEVTGKKADCLVLCAWALSCWKMKNSPDILSMTRNSCY